MRLLQSARMLSPVVYLLVSLCSITFATSVRPALQFVGLDSDNAKYAQTQEGTVVTDAFFLDDTVEEIDIYVSSRPLLAKRTSKGGRSEGSSSIFLGSAVDQDNTDGAPVLVSLVKTEIDGITHLSGYVLFEDVHYSLRGVQGGHILAERRLAENYDPEEIENSLERRQLLRKVAFDDNRLGPWRHWEGSGTTNRNLEWSERILNNDWLNPVNFLVPSQPTKSVSSDSPVVKVLIAFPVDVACHIATLERSTSCDTGSPSVQSALEAISYSAVNLANAAYENSGIDLTMSLAGYRVVSDYAAMSVSPLDQLRSLRYSSTFASLRWQRDDTGADFVVLLTDLPGICGLAYTTGDYNMAYSVVDYKCIPNHSFTHEVAHAMGCDHNIEHADASSGYRFGYRDTRNGFRTIMSYSCTSKELPCPRVAYFSNPDITYRGHPTGTNATNNALWIHSNRYVYPTFGKECSFGWAWLFCVILRLLRHASDIVRSFSIGQ